MEDQVPFQSVYVLPKNIKAALSSSFHQNTVGDGMIQHLMCCYNEQVAKLKKTEKKHGLYVDNMLTAFNVFV
jgi:hypothetical protein